MLFCNLTSNSYLAPPLGFPVRLWPGGELAMTGLIPGWVSSVSADVSAEQGSPTATLAIYESPAISGGDDGELVASSVVTLSSTEQTVSLTVERSSSIVPKCYVVRLTVDGIVTTTLGLDRGSGEPDELPTGANVSSFSVT